jgi:hypothetical protein
MPVLPRNIPSFDTIRIADKPLPTNFVLAMRTNWNNLYDLRDYLLNLFVDDENVALSAPMNGTNKNFTLQAAPQPPQSLELFRNGQLLINGTDYTLVGNSLTLAVAPAAVDSLVAYYRERGTPSTISGAGSVSTGAGGGGGSGGGGGGGGGSTGGLWTLTGNFLYPTTLSNVVLAGVASSDAFITPGAMASTGPLGIMTAATNASTLFFIFSGGLAVIASGASGSGTFLPMMFATSNIERCRITTTGIFLVGFTSTDYFGGPAQIVTQTLGCISAATNASVFSVNVGAAIFFTSQFSGSGTRVPMAWNMATEVMRLTVGGTLLVGLTSSDVFTGSGQIAASSAIGVATSPTNATAFYIQANLGSAIFHNSTHTGTGTALPVVWGINNAEVMRLTTGGTLLVGFTTSDVFVSPAQVAASAMGIITAGTNASTLYLTSSPGTEMQIVSTRSGTGTLLPIAFYTGGARQMTLNVSGGLLLGFTSSDSPVTAASGVLQAAASVNVVNGTTNSLTITMTVDSINGARMVSSHGGGGTTQPFTWQFDFSTERMRLTPAGTIFAGMTSSDIAASIAAYFTTNGGFLAMSGPTNASWLSVNNNGTYSQFNSGHTGTGTTSPMIWMIDTVAKMMLTTAGSLLVGAGSSDLFTAASQIASIGATNAVGVDTAAANGSALYMQAGVGVTLINSTHGGTGTTLPLVFMIDGGEKVRLTTAGTLLVGLASSDLFGSAGQISASNAIGVVSAATNASAIYMFVVAGSEVQLVSRATGTGTLLPLAFVMGGTEIARFTTAGLLLLGHTADDGSGALLQVAGGISSVGTGNEMLISGTGFTNYIRLFGDSVGYVVVGGVAHNVADGVAPSASQVVRRGIVCVS